MILLKNKESISEELLKAIREANTGDIEFQEEVVKGHPHCSKKIGNRPVRINGVVIPLFLIVSFILGMDEKGGYFYVFNKFYQTTQNAESEEEAKLLVFSEIRRILDEQII